MPEIGDTGLFLLNSTQYGDARDSYWSMHVEDICEAMERAGQSCVPWDLSTPEHLNFLREAVNSGHCPKFIASFNFSPALLKDDNDRSEIGVLGGVPCLTLSAFLDHPAHLAAAIMEMEAVIAGHPELRRLRRYLVMEEQHRGFMRFLGVPDESVVVMGQGGPDPVADPLPFAQRQIPIAFSGSIEMPDGDKDFRERAGCNDPALGVLLDAAVAGTLDGTEDVFEVVRAVFADTLTDGTIPDVAALVCHVDRRVRTLRRHRMLAPLHNLPIHYFGNVAPEFQKSRPMGVFHGALPFRELLNRFAHTKVVLNDTINLRGSALARMYYPMSRGCLIASEATPFLSESFLADEEMLMLPGGPASRQVMMACLTAPERAAGMAAAGMARYASGHSWSHRIAAMQSILSGKE